MMTGASHKIAPGGSKSPFGAEEDGHLLDDEFQRPRVITPFPSPKLTTYLCLRQGKARTICDELRSNLITNVVGNYDQTGYNWEHHDQTKGTGEGARVFTGWSALILSIMSEVYPLF